MKTFKTGIAVFALLVALAVPGTALATSGEEGYNGPNSVVAGVDSGSDGPTSGTEAIPVAAETSSSGTLPFTGADLRLIAIAGIALAGVGVGLRKLTRDPS